MDIEGLDSLLDSTIEQGKVYRVHLTQKNDIVTKDGTNERDKYFVLMGKDEENVYGVNLINSEINKGLPPAMQANFYELQADDYSFLRHNSYVDCNVFKPVFPYQLPLSELNRLEQGKLLERDLNGVIDKLKSAESISTIDLITYGIIEDEY